MFTHSTMLAPPGMLKAVSVKHADKSLDDWERRFNIDDSCNWVENLNQEGSNGMLDLLPVRLQEERSTVLHTHACIYMCK